MTTSTRYSVLERRELFLEPELIRHIFGSMILFQHEPCPQRSDNVHLLRVAEDQKDGRMHLLHLGLQDFAFTGDRSISSTSRTFSSCSSKGEGE